MGEYREQLVFCVDECVIWGCAEKGGCRVPRHKPSVTYPLKRRPVTYPLSRSLHVFRRTEIFGYVAKTSLCYIPYVTGYVTRVGQGPCYKPIVLARAHIRARGLRSELSPFKVDKGLIWGYMGFWYSTQKI